jgi:hypothetical protein
MSGAGALGWIVSQDEGDQTSPWWKVKKKWKCVGQTQTLTIQRRQQNHGMDSMSGQDTRGRCYNRVNNKRELSM